MSKSPERQDNICVVCFKTVELYSIGSCDHIVCYECSTRMRVLCRQNECPICRQDMPKVIFTSNVRPYQEIQHGSCKLETKYKILFENLEIQDAYYKLLEHSCSVCPDSPKFKTFQTLYDHMRKEHELYYCDLCIENLKIFSSERRCYTRTALAHHRMKGDPDNRSHRGHPLCEFCDTRYVDSDDLYRHLRRDHLYCHFCDADGQHHYYCSYDYLRDHFRQEHYLCEEGSCIDEKFTSVFRTEIDLRAHKASAHSRGLGKAAAKQARMLELEFTLKPRPQQDGQRGFRARVKGGLGEGSGQEGAVGGCEPPRPPSPQLHPSEFPTLGGGPSMMTAGRGLTIRAVGRRTNAPLAVTDENFPLLGLHGDTVTQATSVRLNINADRSGSSGQEPRVNGGVVRAVRGGNVSIHVNHRPARVTKDDFPALSRTSNETKHQGESSAKWVAVSKQPSANQSRPTQSAPPAKPKPKSDNEFPSLTSQFKSNMKLKQEEPEFVNLRSAIDAKTKAAAAQKAARVSVPEPEPASNTSKGKTKKKKSKSNSSSNVAEINNHVESNKERPDTAKKKTENKKTEVKMEASALKECKEKTESRPLATVEDWSGKSGSRPLPTAEDWFGVTGASKTKNPPPGFHALNGEPSGVSSASKPPPGFLSNGLTFTNSSGQSYAIPTKFNYIPPNNFAARNQSLVTTVNQILLNDSSLENFRRVSALFREDKLSAEDYYQHCLRTMGEGGVAQVFPEMVVLLPDIAKQLELYMVYNKSAFAKQNKKQKLESCKTCRQVLAGQDLKIHQGVHNQEAQKWTIE